jgi:phage tail sheath protein FI
MAEIFLHGRETIERDAGNPRYVAAIDSGIIWLVGTAPSANETLYPLNQPKVMRGFEDFPQGLGSAGTLPDQLSRVLQQAGRMSQTVYFARVAEGANAAEGIANVLGSRSARTGLHALSRVPGLFNQRPKLLCAPGFTSLRPTTGAASVSVTDGGEAYTRTPVVTVARGVGDTTGTGMQIGVTINAGGEVDAAFVINPGIGYTAAPVITVARAEGDSTGTGATLSVTLGASANPVAAELATLANRNRAMAVVTGPNTDAAAAVNYRLDFDSDRLMVLDPFALFEKGGTPTSMPADAAVCGLQARVDYEEGFWVSPSNHVVNGVLGTHRPIEHSLSDRSVESQYLNRNHVSTIVRSPQGGWKLFGNRVAASDPLKVFWSVRRAHDVIIESIEIASEVFMDKPFSKQNLVDIAETVNRAIRRWQALGATLGGRVWLDPALNTAESLSSGILYIHYDGEAPAPMEHIVFVFNRNTGYYNTVLASAAREIARQSALAG